MLSSSTLIEEGAVTILPISNALENRHLPIGLDSVFQAIQLPAGIADLDASLTNMNGDTLTLQRKVVSYHTITAQRKIDDLFRLV